MDKNNSKYNKERAIDLLSLGKMPPQAVDIEKAVLGAMLIDSEAVLEISDLLTPETFYTPEHQLIFKSILSLAKKMHPIDIITVCRELKNTDSLDIIGGEIYISELTDRVATSAHIEFHAKILHQKYIARQLITIGAKIQQRSFNENEDVQDLVEFAESQVYNLSNNDGKKQVSLISNLTQKSLEALEKRSIEKKSVIGLPCGFSQVDRITGGFQPSEFIIIAARPAMGKTSYALNVCRNMAIDFDIPVAVFSLEMSETQLTDRLLISESGITGDNYKAGRLSDSEWDTIEVTSGKIEKAKIFIDDTAAISVWELRSKARKLVRLGVRAVVIDYLQLMTAGKDYSGNREGEISTISRTLKAIAKELNIVIIALSQLNRGLEMRADKRPMLSDLRESGAIEQDADIVMFIHRPEYYGIKNDENGESTYGLAEIIIAKHRSGQTGKVKLKFNGSTVKFSDCENEIVKPTQIVVESNNDIPMNTSFYDIAEETEAPF